MEHPASDACDLILNRTRAEATPPGPVVLDLSASPLVDSQSAHTLADMADEPAAAGIRVSGGSPDVGAATPAAREGRVP